MNEFDKIWNETMGCGACDVKPCEDAVSREDVDDYIAKLMSGYLYDEERTRLEEFSAYLWELPSVTPQRQKGKWIYQLNRINLPICSECDNPNEFGKEYKFCPNCGAYMRGGGEDGVSD